MGGEVRGEICRTSTKRKGTKRQNKGKRANYKKHQPQLISLISHFFTIESVSIPFLLVHWRFLNYSTAEPKSTDYLNSVAESLIIFLHTQSHRLQQERGSRSCLPLTTPVTSLIHEAHSRPISEITHMAVLDLWPLVLAEMIIGQGNGTTGKRTLSRLKCMGCCWSLVMWRVVTLGQILRINLARHYVSRSIHKEGAGTTRISINHYRFSRYTFFLLVIFDLWTESKWTFVLNLSSTTCIPGYLLLVGTLCSFLSPCSISHWNSMCHVVWCINIYIVAIMT